MRRDQLRGQRAPLEGRDRGLVEYCRPRNGYRVGLNGSGYGSAGGLSGTVSLVTSNLLSVIDGSTYVNFHTTNYPAGEIRGHLLR